MALSAKRHAHVPGHMGVSITDLLIFVNGTTFSGNSSIYIYIYIFEILFIVVLGQEPMLTTHSQPVPI